MHLPHELPGTPYVLLSRIGEGGMGRVFEGLHRGLGRHVAVKLLNEHRESDPDAIDRMRLEAQALARVSHPAIVGVHDVGLAADGTPFVVMELARGETLHTRLKHARLPLREAMRVVRVVAEGLHATHLAGFVHRDVKPSNVVLLRDGGVKLLDFGIAKVVSARAGVRPPSNPTADGLPVGTPFYFAPEQALGQRVDGRADVYACGVMLWLLLCGRRLFDGAAGMPALVRAHTSEPAPRPSASGMVAPAEVEAMLDAVVLRALEKTPSMRFATAEDFAAALRAIEAVLDQEPRPEGRGCQEPRPEARGCEESRPVPRPRPSGRGSWEAPVSRPPLPRPGLWEVSFVLLVCGAGAILAILAIFVLERLAP